MKKIVFIVSISILVGCTFKAQRKSEINQRIRDLQQRIEHRTAEKDSCNQFLDSAMIALDNGSIKLTDRNPEQVIHFFDSIRPISDRLSELEAQDEADDAEISKLIEQRSRL